MNDTIVSPSVSPIIANQQRYVTQQAERNDDSLVVGDAFVRGIRDLGYRSTATALDELIDNSLQAGSDAVHIVFGYGNTTGKPSSIAVIDNGAGMIPEMLRFAVKWGGTDRENDRKGFGRYGYGLPSASVSQATRFTVYSRVAAGDLYGITIDLEAMSRGEYTVENRIITPDPVLVKLPADIEAYVKEHFDGLPHGAIVLWENLDRLTWKTTTALRTHLLQHTGLIYRNFLRRSKIVIDGTEVEPIDPLFLTPGARYYDYDSDRAEGLPPLEVKVKDEGGKQIKGVIKARFSYLPPTFGRDEKRIFGRGKANPRFSIMEEHEGIIVMRNGRQIDVLQRAKWGSGVTYRNTDRYWQVELDFSAELDEEFSVTTSKQGVTLSPRIWDLLAHAGVKPAIEQMQKRFNEDRKKLEDLAEADENAKRASEQAMEDAAKFKTRKPGADPIEQEQKSRQLVEDEVQRRVQDTKVPKEDVERALEQEIAGRPYIVLTESLPGAPFFRMEQFGGQKRLYINTSHRFYLDVYGTATATSEAKDAIEILLFVIGDCELDSERERATFYQQERAEWSRTLDVALRQLQEQKGD